MAGLSERHFNFKEREPALYAEWEKCGVFRPEQASDPKAPTFCLAMPPPNANGELHLGHVYGETVMDMLARFHRARGKRVLVIPGKDHAGIQTQVVYERKLKSEGIEPRELGREEFYERCYEFCIDRASYMRGQEKSIGVSADWDRELFTLDPRLNRTVFETFEKMWAEGLVYRGSRIVNWSVYSQTAISDIEVEYADAKGHLWYLRYPWEKTLNLPSRKVVDLPPAILEKQSKSDRAFYFTRDGSGVQSGDLCDEGRRIVSRCARHTLNAETFSELLKKYDLELSAKERELIGAAEFCIVELLPYFDISLGLITATTRPETMLGDAALAVHPEDPRYQSSIGNSVRLPLCDRSIPVIADERIDMDFGTGVVKVTPAHDFVDYAIGQTHKLPIIQVIGKDGKMTEQAPAVYRGLETKACRQLVIETLDSQKLLLETREISHKVPISERGKDVIEPLVAEQWWVSVDKPIARLGGKSLKQRVLELLNSDKIAVHPANFKQQISAWFERLQDWNISRQIWWSHRIPAWYKNGPSGVEIKVGTHCPGTDWTQDEDTFDTWFSSGQWAYSTVAAHGLLDLKNPTTSEYFPTHTMVMGRDILFFWACRMLLLTAYRLDDIPWKNIFFTGLVRDEHGQKMSKSKGNGIEPKAMLDKYGADALRLGIIMGTSPGLDTNIGEKKIEGYSRFVNKLWNSAKLIEQRVRELPSLQKAPDTLQLKSSRWIVSQIAGLFKSITTKMESYELALALEELYQFTWFTYCDWYLEILKSASSLANEAAKAEARWVAVESFRTILQLWHPFTPFITEEIFQALDFLQDDAWLAARKWKTTCTSDLGTSPDGVSRALEVVTGIRSLKAAVGLPHAEIRACLPGDFDPELQHLVQELGRVRLVAEAEIPDSKRVRKPFPGGTFTCEVDNVPDYVKKLTAESQKLSGFLQSLERKLSGDFAKRADPKLVTEEKQKYESTKKMLEDIRTEISLTAQS